MVNKLATSSSFIAAFGLLLALIGVAAYSIYGWAYLEVVPGWTSLMISVIVVSFFQLVTLSVIGEYVGRIYLSTKNRPLFIIEDGRTQFPTMTTLHEYTEEFFEYIERGSTASAKRFSAFIAPLLGIKSILDVGCGRGAWLREWRDAGVKVVHGADGPYVRRESLLIPTEDFTAIDLSQKFDLGRRYDLVSSLEVAEHLPRSASKAFISSLVAHSDLILFSAATRGQGGENHINERPLWYWQSVFAEHGYVAFDAIRPRLSARRTG